MSGLVQSNFLDTPPMPEETFKMPNSQEDDLSPNAGLHGLYPSLNDAEQGIYEICCRKVLVFQDPINHNVNAERFFLVDFEDLMCVPKELEYRISNEQTHRARKEPIGLLFRDKRNGGKLCLVRCHSRLQLGLNDETIEANRQAVKKYFYQRQKKCRDPIKCYLACVDQFPEIQTPWTSKYLPKSHREAQKGNLFSKQLWTSGKAIVLDLLRNSNLSQISSSNEASVRTANFVLSGGDGISKRTPPPILRNVTLLGGTGTVGPVWQQLPRECKLDPTRGIKKIPDKTASPSNGDAFRGFDLNGLMEDIRENINSCSNSTESDGGSSGGSQKSGEKGESNPPERTGGAGRGRGAVGGGSESGSGAGGGGGEEPPAGTPASDPKDTTVSEREKQLAQLEKELKEKSEKRKAEKLKQREELDRISLVSSALSAGSKRHHPPSKEKEVAKKARKESPESTGAARTTIREEISITKSASSTSSYVVRKTTATGVNEAFRDTPETLGEVETNPLPVADVRTHRLLPPDEPSFGDIQAKIIELANVQEEGSMQQRYLNYLKEQNKKFYGSHGWDYCSNEVREALNQGKDIVKALVVDQDRLIADMAFEWAVKHGEQVPNLSRYPISDIIKTIQILIKMNGNPESHMVKKYKETIETLESLPQKDDHFDDSLLTQKQKDALEQGNLYVQVEIDRLNNEHKSGTLINLLLEELDQILAARGKGNGSKTPSPTESIDTSAAGVSDTSTTSGIARPSHTSSETRLQQEPGSSRTYPDRPELKRKKPRGSGKDKTKSPFKKPKGKPKRKSTNSESAVEHSGEENPDEPTDPEDERLQEIVRQQLHEDLHTNAATAGLYGAINLRHKQSDKEIRGLVRKETQNAEDIKELKDDMQSALKMLNYLVGQKKEEECNASIRKDLGMTDDGWDSIHSIRIVFADPNLKQKLRNYVRDNVSNFQNHFSVNLATLLFSNRESYRFYPHPKKGESYTEEPRFQLGRAVYYLAPEFEDFVRDCIADHRRAQRREGREQQTSGFDPFIQLIDEMLKQWRNWFRNNRNNHPWRKFYLQHYYNMWKLWIDPLANKLGEMMYKDGKESLGVLWYTAPPVETDEDAVKRFVLDYYDEVNESWEVVIAKKKNFDMDKLAEAVAAGEEDYKKAKEASKNLLDSPGGVGFIDYMSHVMAEARKKATKMGIPEAEVEDVTKNLYLNLEAEARRREDEEEARANAERSDPKDKETGS